MHKILLVLGASGLVTGAAAQALPIPRARNPDWTLIKMEPRSYGVPPVHYEAVDHMPNAGPRSISGTGSRQYYWDTTRQLGYEWLSQPGSDSPTPDGPLIVHDERTGTTYIYRRTLAEPRQWVARKVPLRKK